MKISIKTNILFAGIMLSGFFASAQIEGGVSGIDGKGIANAMVIATDTNKMADTVLADNRGFYAFNSLKMGKYKVEVKAAGFINAVFENVKVIKEISDANAGSKDVSSATRLNVLLLRNKVP